VQGNAAGSLTPFQWVFISFLMAPFFDFSWSGRALSASGLFHIAFATLLAGGLVHPPTIRFSPCFPPHSWPVLALNSPAFDSQLSWHVLFLAD